VGDLARRHPNDSRVTKTTRAALRTENISVIQIESIQETRVDNDYEPATKADIAGVKQEVAMHGSEVHRGYECLMERIAEFEAKLLKAFRTCTRLNEKRLAETDVEKRLNMPPAA
jgi:hypothetical protein